jgi:hypothetical protein
MTEPELPAALVAAATHPARALARQQANLAGPSDAP